ncbi:hypothetical protein K6Q96_12685 [Grimontia kaedaensis]|uniref:Lipoprotein n=1 Tax=Grimontia kaedaensis TaxID=2872157 RepID=A0ABY4WQB7_9GAMM|nr:hypothetical protein [Grimontia kaedaensis]USH01728.1 hypothetical protein K6Q96_12685 [Grimontia kaedaensis]
MSVVKICWFLFISISLIACGGGGDESTSSATPSPDSASITPRQTQYEVLPLSNSAPDLFIPFNFSYGESVQSLYYSSWRESTEPFAYDYQLRLFNGEPGVTIFSNGFRDRESGVYTDKLWFQVCYDEACSREITGSPFAVDVNYRVIKQTLEHSYSVNLRDERFKNDTRQIRNTYTFEIGNANNQESFNVVSQTNSSDFISNCDFNLERTQVRCTYFRESFHNMTQAQIDAGDEFTVSLCYQFDANCEKPADRFVQNIEFTVIEQPLALFTETLDMDAIYERGRFYTSGDMIGGYASLSSPQLLLYKRDGSGSIATPVPQAYQTGVFTSYGMYEDPTTGKPIVVLGDFFEKTFAFLFVTPDFNNAQDTLIDTFEINTPDFDVEVKSMMKVEDTLFLALTNSELNAYDLTSEQLLFSINQAFDDFYVIDNRIYLFKNDGRQMSMTRVDHENNETTTRYTKELSVVSHRSICHEISTMIENIFYTKCGQKILTDENTSIDGTSLGTLPRRPWSEDFTGSISISELVSLLPSADNTLVALEKDHTNNAYYLTKFDINNQLISSHQLSLNDGNSVNEFEPQAFTYNNTIWLIGTDYDASFPSAITGFVTLE